jgi:hypothetical protein
MQVVSYVVDSRLHDGFTDAFAAVVGITDHNMDAWWMYAVVFLELDPNDSNRYAADDDHPGYLFLFFFKFNKLAQDASFTFSGRWLNFMLGIPHAK